MILKIDDSRKLSDIQQEISEDFPGLWIEFYSESYLPDGIKQVSVKLGGESELKKLRTQHNEGFLNIDASLPVFELVENFSELFGLNVKLFEKNNEELKDIDSASGIPLSDFIRGGSTNVSANGSV
jgi:hypothetical protein